MKKIMLTAMLAMMSIGTYAQAASTAFADNDDVVVDTTAVAVEEDLYDYITPETMKAAKKGDVEAMYLVATGLQRTEGFPKGLKKAAKWYKKAAKKGHVQSMMELGHIYLFALPTYNDEKSGREKKNPFNKPADGIAWFVKAAEAGNLKGYTSIGDFYLYHRDQETDNETGIEWYKKAAEAGSMEATVELGKIYLLMEENPAEAKVWLEKAASMGDVEAMSMLAHNYLEEKTFGIDYEKGMMYLKRVAESGDINAMLLMGRYYCEGEVVTMNVVEGKRWFTKAEQELLKYTPCDVSDEYLQLTKWHMTGVGKMKADKAKADLLLNLLKASKCSSILSYVGDWYYDGEDGIKKSYLEAIKWYKLGAECGDTESMAKIGTMYYNGDGVLANAKEAVKWFEKAGINGCYGLGLCYYHGSGVEKDRDKAIELIKEACIYGNEDAIEFLESIGEEIPELW